MAGDAAIVTCALTGVLTNPAVHNVPVTPEQMAAEATRAWEAGAVVMHLHYRNQTPGMGWAPTWEPAVVCEIVEAIREACPGVLINSSTGTVGNDISGPVGAIEASKPEIAAMNAGSLNYLKARSNGTWAWPPMLFDNPVDKIERFVKVMNESGIVPEWECFDTGIVRSVAMFKKVGLTQDPLHINFVMGVASGMAADPRLIPILKEYLPEGAHFQSTLIGRQEIWATHQATADHGGDVRTGLEDTFYLPNGDKVSSNGPLIEALVAVVREAGRRPATVDEARAAYGLA